MAKFKVSVHLPGFFYNPEIIEAETIEINSSTYVFWDGEPGINRKFIKSFPTQYTIVESWDHPEDNQ